MPKGTLIIRLIKAELTRNRELFGKMDPFARFVHGSMTIESKVIKGGGMKPEWREDLEFRVKGFDEEISVEILDKESMTKDDSIGKAILRVDDLIAMAQRADSTQDFEIQYKGPLGLKTKCAGKVFISSKFESSVE